MLQNRQHRIINTEFDKKKKRFAKIRRGIAEFCHPPHPPFPPSQKNENSAEKTKQNARNNYQKLWSCLCSSLTLVIDRDETTNRFLSSPFFASFFLLLLLFPLFPPPSLFPNSRVIDSRTTSGMPPIESGSRRSVASHTTWLTDSACPTARVFIFICRWPVAPVYYFRGNYVFEPCPRIKCGWNENWHPILGEDICDETFFFSFRFFVVSEYLSHILCHIFRDDSIGDMVEEGGLSRERFIRNLVPTLTWIWI